MGKPPLRKCRKLKAFAGKFGVFVGKITSHLLRHRIALRLKSQSVYRKIQSEGLQNTYTTDEAFALHAQMIPALAFVPVNDVITAFEALQDDAPAELAPILDYFEDNYVGRPRRRNRANPLYALATWNVSNRVHDQLPRTNNHVEGFHRKMVAALTYYHPCL